MAISNQLLGQKLHINSQDVQHDQCLYSGHASVQTSGISLTLRNRGKGGWARDLRGRRQNCLPRYSAGVKSRSVVLGYPS